MICFEGQYSKKACNFIFKKYFFTIFWIGLFAVILGCIPLILMIMKKVNPFNSSFAVYVGWMISVFLIAIFIFCLPCIAIKKQLPVKIEIEGDYVSCVFSDSNLYGKTRYSNIKYIKKVIDYGDYYYISFLYPHKIIGCVCQKDLMVQGTIEEFEDLFENYIVREIK